MNYLTWINQLRAQTGDIKKRVHVDWIGDNATNVFQMPADTFPVLDDTTTYTVKLNGSTQTESTHYTLDKTTGTLTMVSTPGNNIPLTIDSISVFLLDTDWLQITNDVIKSLGNDFWKEFVDTTLTTTAGMLSISLASAQPYCIAVYEFQHRSSSAMDFIPVAEYCNWRYDQDNNIIYIGAISAFPTSGETLRVRGLKTYVLGDTTDDTLDVQDKFLTIIEYGCIARYWRWRYKSVVELVSKMTQEATRTPLQELVMLSDRFDRLYEIEKAKLKPTKPARIIPPFKQNGGRP